MSVDYDVVVIGGGGAGMAAAITASDAGATVLLVDGARKLGGSTALSLGVISAAGTSLQAERGIEDDPESFYYDYLTLNAWRVEPGIVRTLCEGSAPAVAWLRDLGLTYGPNSVYRSGVERRARGHEPSGGGAQLAGVLEAALRARPVDIALDNRVTELILEGQVVRGCRARGDAVAASSVILATGGFGHNGGLIEEYYPRAAAAGSWTWSISACTSRGDGLLMAREAGALIAGSDRGLVSLTPGFTRVLERVDGKTGLPGWLLFVDGRGHRFVNETAPYAVMSGIVADHGGRCWAILDEEARVKADAPPSWDPATLSGHADSGRIGRAATLEELAGKIGFDAPALAASVEEYNLACARGRDERFEKAPEHLRPLRSPPFYAVELRPSVIALTAAGPAIDTSGQVLSNTGAPIPGLYAAGEVCGNVLGERYVGGGNSLANCIVFGQIAGHHAAFYAKRQETT